MPYLAKYGVEFTLPPIPILKKDDTDFAATGDWTPVSGDVKISKDAGNVVNIADLPTAVGGSGSVLWKFVLSITEMQAKTISIQIVDAALEDQVITIQTYGHASAQIVGDLDSVAETGDEMALENDAITLAKFDESTAWPLVAADSGATQVARVGADSDTLETLSDQIGAIPTTAMRGTDSAATATDLSTHDGKLDTAQSDLDKLTGTDGATLATLQGNYAPAKAGAEMAIVNGSIKLATYDGSTAFPLVATDSAATQVARVGADGDTLKDLSDNLAVIESELDGLIVTVGTAGAGLTDLGGMSDAMKVEVNDEMLDVFVTDTFAELGAVPVATASLKDKIVYAAMFTTNLVKATSSAQTLRNRGNTVDVAVAPLSSDGTTSVRGEFV